MRGLWLVVTGWLLVTGLWLEAYGGSPPWCVGGSGIVTPPAPPPNRDPINKIKK